jgi:uncharacterized membrane protein
MPIGWIWSRTHLGLDAEALERLTSCVHRGVAVGFERTATQDIGFGLRQLTDAANKALSPGINDPTTAVHALGHSAALLCEIADRELGSWILADEDGVARVVLHRPDLTDLLDLAITQPRRYGAADPAVLAQIYVLLRQLGWRGPPSARAAVELQRHRLDATAAAQDFDSAERAHLAGLSDLVAASVQGRWPPSSLSGPDQ